MDHENAAPLPFYPESAADGGLLGRRAFLTHGAGLAAVAVTGGLLASDPSRSEAAEINALDLPSWSKIPGAPFRPYGLPSRFEDNVKRTVRQPFGPIAPGTGSSVTPLEMLTGTITPNGLHFERHHNGVPDIDPAQHKLLIHGLVKRPLVFTLDTLLRYPMVSRICFLECSGNSQLLAQPEPAQRTCGFLHGMVSCSEWTGIALSTLLDEVGVDPKGKWLLAEGADAASMSRSIPLEKALDDTMLALYQNGEPIRPEQGYPMRLLVPGWEGNVNVKWLRRLKVSEGPTHTRDETSKYTDLMPNGKARQFTLPLDVKSVITRPSFGLSMQGAGFYEISGLAWSGAGRIAKVEISADGGKTWAEAALQAPILPKSVVRFRLAWRWDGAPAMLQSRATDEKGNVQPARQAWIAEYSPSNTYHCNAIQTWSVGADGGVKNAYL